MNILDSQIGPDFFAAGVDPLPAEAAGPAFNAVSRIALPGDRVSESPEAEAPDAVCANAHCKARERLK